MKQQILEKEGRLPDAVVACIGGGSNTIGSFVEFIGDKTVKSFGSQLIAERHNHIFFY